MTNHRQHFFSVLQGKHPANMPFFPDITDWYSSMRSIPGRPRDGGAGIFTPDSSPMHKVAGCMPEKYRNHTLMDFYRENDWGFHAHIYGWHDDIYSGDITVKTTIEGDKRTQVIKTPKGSLTRTDMMAGDGSWSRKEFPVKEIKDLEIMQYVIEHHKYVADYGKVQSVRDGLASQGQGDIVLPRSPFGKLVHEYMGFENVIYAMMDYPEKMVEFMTFQEKKDLELVELAAKAPEQLVIMSDHTDEILISPDQWRDYCIPYYKKITAILHKAGKYISTHLDGNFKSYFPYLSEPGFDLLDGCTPAPMFNYEVEELAAALPDKMYAFCGIPATLFCQNLPTKEILKFSDRILTSFKGRAIINIGDILPPNGDIEQVIALGRHVKESWK